MNQQMFFYVSLMFLLVLDVLGIFFSFFKSYDKYLIYSLSYHAKLEMVMNLFKNLEKFALDCVLFIKKQRIAIDS